MVSEIKFKSLEFEIEVSYGLTPRTFRYYQTKGMVPSPIRTTHDEGAVYDREKVFRHLDIIKTFKDKFKITIDAIHEIMKNYEGLEEELKEVLEMVIEEYSGSKDIDNYDDLCLYQATCRYVKNKVVSELSEGKKLGTIDPIELVRTSNLWVTGNRK